MPAVQATSLPLPAAPPIVPASPNPQVALMPLRQPIRSNVDARAVFLPVESIWPSGATTGLWNRKNAPVSQILTPAWPQGRTDPRLTALRPSDTSPERVLRRSADFSSLPSIQGGRATWSIVSNAPLAVVAYEWLDLK